MDIKSCLCKYINCTQIKALLWKDILVKRRQPVSLAFTNWPTTILIIVFVSYSVVDCYTVPLAPHNIPNGLSTTTEIRCIWCRWMPISDPRIAVQNFVTAILSILHLHNRKCLFKHTKLFGNIGFWNGTVSLNKILMNVSMTHRLLNDLLWTQRKGINIFQFKFLFQYHASCKYNTNVLKWRQVV